MSSSGVGVPGSCRLIPHGPGEPCTCDGCWACDAQANENYDKEHAGQFRPDIFISAPGGHVMDCSCDIDWEHVYGYHTLECGYAEEIPEGRCESCEHGTWMHDDTGRCWFTVDRGVPEMNLVCPCKLNYASDAED